MQEEIWKDIPNYEGYYQVSNLGKVKSLLFQNNVYKKKYKREKILKQKLDKFRNYRVELWKDGKHKTLLVARLVATTFLDNLINTDMTVNHKNGNRLDNRIENLEWTTREENIKLAFEDDLMKFQKPCILFNDHKEIHCRSLEEANRKIGRKHNYVAKCIKTNRLIKSIDNEIFSIRILR